MARCAIGTVRDLETDRLIRKASFHETTDDRSRACGAVFQCTGFFRVEERERRCQEQGDQFGGEERPHQRRGQEQSHFVDGEEPGELEAIIADRKKATRHSNQRALARYALYGRRTARRTSTSWITVKMNLIQRNAIARPVGHWRPASGVMEDTFSLDGVSGGARLVFNQPSAQAHFGASVFRVRRLACFPSESELVSAWAVKRDGNTRGIVEVMKEAI